MTFPVKFQPLAESDLNDASAWYEGKQDDLGLAFLEEVDRCLSIVARKPMQFPVWEGNVRYVQTHRFPYRIFYFAEQERVVVLAILHNKRDPAALRTRIF